MDMIPETSMWLIYLGVLIGPFIQEDAAVIAAASLSISESHHWLTIFVLIVIGLILSDAWKYFPGWAARRFPKARRFAENPRVQQLQSVMANNSIKTLFTVRFVPLARIPAYVAAGFFKINYLKYLLTISASALVYSAVIFTIFHVLGELVGERVKTIMPVFGGIAALVIIGMVLWKSRGQSKKLQG